MFPKTFSISILIDYDYMETTSNGLFGMFIVYSSTILLKYFINNNRRSN